jgi:hypothetical protein
LAKEVAKDVAKSYVGQCFQSVFSAIYKKPLAVATGQALKELLELLELIQNELLDADLEREQLEDWVADVRLFVRHKDVPPAIGALFLDPDYQLDPAVLARAWQAVKVKHTLPDGFSWQRIAKRLARKTEEIRQSSSELRDTFQLLASARMSEGIKELVGLPPDFDLETYREALVERFGNLKFDMLDTTGAYYSGVRLWSVFVPQSVRECHEYTPQLLEMPKEHLRRLVDKGELDAGELAEAERLQDERRRHYVSQPLRPVLEVVGEPSALAAGGTGMALSTGVASPTLSATGPTLARSAQMNPLRLVILGDPGSGKSSLLQFLALRWARIEDANLRYTQPLPLLIELRDYNRWQCSGGKSFPRYLHEASTWHRLNQQTLDHLLKQPGRVVLLLDGLDEVFDPAQRQDVINDIHRFSNEYPGTRLVVTSRVVGYQPQRLRDAEFRHFMLQDLDDGQIGAFLDKWHEVTFDDQAEAAGKNQRLRTAIKNSKSIAQLAGNPLLLTMMAILNRHQELPRDRVDLYQQCSRLLLHQWDVERTLGEFPGLSAEIGLREKTDILRTIAYAMQTGLSRLSLRESSATFAERKATNGSNYIDGTTLTSLIEDYLHTELHFEQARAAARALVEQLRTRNFILCYLGADSYAFVHRTLLEYFCAADIVHQFNVAKTLSEQDLIALFDAHCRDDDWREVLRLICGQIDEQFVGRIVEHLATLPTDGDLPRELPLAIYCLSDLRNLDRFENVGEDLFQAALTAARSACEGSSIANFFLDEVIPACRAIGDRWPKTSSVPVPDDFVDMSWNYRNPYLEFTAAVAPNRELFEAIVANDTYSCLTAASLFVLANLWPDETTWNLLCKSTTEVNDYDVRCVSLQALAEKWPDENTRELLAQRAAQDDDEDVRSAALQALAEKWPDETTRKLLTDRAPVDGAAASVFGGQHSEFGRKVFRKYANDYASCLNPREPISREHIERAAKYAGVAAERIDEMVRSLSEHLGWDITRGSGAE